MQHVCTPILADGESCCSQCGAVLESRMNHVADSGNELLITTSSSFFGGLDRLMVGTGFEKTKYWQSSKNKDIQNKLRVLDNLQKVTREFGLNDRIACETMRRLLKKNRGFYSFKWQIRELLEVLNADYRYLYQQKAIRKKYEMVTGC